MYRLTRNTTSWWNTSKTSDLEHLEKLTKKHIERSKENCLAALAQQRPNMTPCNRFLHNPTLEKEARIPLKCNYHTHTTRCKHAFGEDEAFVQAAITAGFDVLGFADHAPWPYR